MLSAGIGLGSLGWRMPQGAAGPGPGCQQEEPRAQLNVSGALRFSRIGWDSFSIANLMIRRNTMPILLWLLGVPITVIIILLLLGVI